MAKRLEDYIFPQDLPETAKNGEPNIWREVADKFGIGVVIFFSKRAGGGKVDVPVWNRVAGKALNRTKDLSDE